LRALETGRWVVQAAPTGFTAIVDANGTVLQRTAVSEQRILYADVPMRSGFTWYTRLGDRPVIIVLALALGTVLVIARRHRHASGSQ
jgi:apolipoprotein N-acyltransferase